MTGTSPAMTLRSRLQRGRPPGRSLSLELTMRSHREARIAGLSLAAVYAMCLLLTAVGMT